VSAQPCIFFYFRPWIFVSVMCLLFFFFVFFFLKYSIL